MGTVKPVCAIQARMSSKRLPGKVLMDICGAPMIQRVWDAVEGPAWSRVILTSNHPTDDELVQYVIDHGMLHKSGSLHDVLERYIMFMKRAQPPIMVRVCGDAPFLKKSWVFRAIESVERDQQPVFVPGALHAGTYEDWMECWKEIPNWHPDREHAGHDWFKDNGKTIELTPEGYLTVNTQEELDQARKLWAVKHP